MQGLTDKLKQMSIVSYIGIALLLSEVAYIVYISVQGLANNNYTSVGLLLSGLFLVLLGMKYKK